MNYMRKQETSFPLKDFWFCDSGRSIGSIKSKMKELCRDSYIYLRGYANPKMIWCMFDARISKRFADQQDIIVETFKH